VTRPVIVIVGAGTGVGGSVARAFAWLGHDVGLLGIDEDQMLAIERSLPEGTRCEHEIADLTDQAAAAAAITGLAEVFGRVDVLHFNPSAFRQKNPLVLSVPELLEDVALGIGALLTALQAVRPYMSAGGRVTATGSMAADKPWNEAASLGVQKAGLRNLVHSIDKTLAPDGIRAVSVTVRGTLSDSGPFTPDRVADAIVTAAMQPEDTWQTEVPYSG